MTKLFLTKGMTIKIQNGEHGVRNNLQGSWQKQKEEICSSTRVVNDNINEEENIVKTRYGRTVKKPDRLMHH